MTATMKLNKRLDLDFLKIKLPDIVSSGRKTKDGIVSKRSFASVKWKLPSYKVTALIYATGNIVLVGAPNVEQLELAANYIFKRLGGEGDPTVEYSNFVGTYNCGFPLKLPELFNTIKQSGLGYASDYSPDLFHGLVWSPNGTKNKITIFRTGKIIITGCKTIRDVTKTCNSFLDLLLVHCMDNLFELELIKLNMVESIYHVC